MFATVSLLLVGRQSNWQSQLTVRSRLCYQLACEPGQDTAHFCPSVPGFGPATVQTNTSNQLINPLALARHELFLQFLCPRTERPRGRKKTVTLSHLLSCRKIVSSLWKNLKVIFTYSHVHTHTHKCSPCDLKEKTVLVLTFQK